MRPGVTILVIVAVAGLAALAYFAVPPTAPAVWTEIHVGMSRPQVLALAGTPQQSGWPENISETWQRTGFLSHRRLFVLYDGENVRSVCDGTWFRGYGWWRPRIEGQ